MRYNFDEMPDRRKSDSVKWKYYDEDVIPLWVADMDFVSPEPVVRALHERVEHGVFGYPVGVGNDPGELIELRHALISRLEDFYNWRVQPEDLLILPGVARGFNLACHAMAAPGSQALVQTPIYPPFLKAPGYGGMALYEAELERKRDGSYGIDWDAFKAGIQGDTRLFILCNPHNPVGRVYTRPELETMAEICLRREVVICSDEIHCDLLFSGHNHIPIASLDESIAQNTITLIAPTKTFNIAGLGVSAAVIQNPALRQRFRIAQKGLVGWVNIMGLAAALAAYRKGGEWLQQLLVYLEANRDYLYDFVKAELPGISMAKPEGTYLAWLDCRESGIQGNPYKFFLDNARVALGDGVTFGKGGEGFVRLNFGCPRPILVDALYKIKDAMALQI